MIKKDRNSDISWILNELKNMKTEILNIKLKEREQDKKIKKISFEREKKINEFDQIIINNLESRICILEEESEKYNRK